MKFQLIASASALLLSTVSATFPIPTQGEYDDNTLGSLLGNAGGLPTQQQQLPPNNDNNSGAVFNSADSGVPLGDSDDNGDVGTPLLGPNLAAFNNAFVARPNPFPDNSAAFRNGRQVGIRQAQNTWQRLGGTCWTAWPSYSDAINRIIQRLQNAQFTDRNQGRIAGLNQELERRRWECRGWNPNPPRPNPPRPSPRNPQVCIRFGNEAARRIAWRHCNPWIVGNDGNQSSWRRDCRDVAINTCRGQVVNEVQNQCGLPDTRTLRQLQNECTEKVDSMIDNSSGSGRGGRGSWNAEEEMMLS